MFPDRYATFAQALVRAREKLPFDVHPIDVLLKNGETATDLAEGSLMMLDQSSTGVDSDGNYFQVLLPSVAGNLATAGSYHLVAQQTILRGASGWFRLFGDTKLNLAASSPTIGTLLYTRGLNPDATSTVTPGGKLIGVTKIATTTGVVRVFFDGRGLAAVPTLVGLQEEVFRSGDIYVGTTTPLVTGTAEIATNSLVTNRTWNSADGGVTIGWTDWLPPKRWDLGTITFQPFISSASATGGPAMYFLDGAAVSSSDTLNATVGTAQSSLVTMPATANVLVLGAVSAAITIGGTPAANDLIKLRIRRVTTDAGDTNVDTLRLHGFKVFYTSNATTDT
jgi:hypothetical protein